MHAMPCRAVLRAWYAVLPRSLCVRLPVSLPVGLPDSLPVSLPVRPHVCPLVSPQITCSQEDRVECHNYAIFKRNHTKRFE